MTPGDADVFFQCFFVGLFLTGIIFGVIIGGYVWTWIREKRHDGIQWVSDVSKLPDPKVLKELREFEKVK